MRLLVLGGSLGAALKCFAAAGSGCLRARGADDSLTVWQQCGQRNRSEADDAWASLPFQNLRCDDYIDDMASAYAWADVVIARAGALTVSELAQTGTASILIPLPHAIDDHQTVNARALEACGAAVLLPQGRLRPTRLPMCWRSGLPPSTLASMSVAAGAAAQRDATTRVAAVLMEVAHAALEPIPMVPGGMGAFYIFMVGIGGAGMSGIAEVLVGLGYTVTGSDQTETPVIDRLRTLGVTVHIGHRAEHVDQADVLVVSAAVPEDNPERLAAQTLRIPVVPVLRCWRS